MSDTRTPGTPGSNAGKGQGGSCADDVVPGDSPSSQALGSAEAFARGIIGREEARARGIVEWAGDGGGIAGAAFGMEYRRLGEGTCAAALEAMAAQRVESVGTSGVVSEARPLSGFDRQSLGAAFDAWSLREIEDGSIATDIERGIAEVAAEHPNLDVYAVKAASSTQRIGGVAFVDSATREAVWLFGRAVRMTTDLRR